jgi:hypothetical protein
MQRTLAITLFSLVVLSAAWLVFAGVLLVRDFDTLNCAPEGATMRMHQGVVEVISAGDSGTIIQMVEPIHFSRVVPAMAAPFLVIFAAALMGCYSFVQTRRNAPHFPGIAYSSTM